MPVMTRVAPLLSTRLRLNIQTSSCTDSQQPPYHADTGTQDHRIHQAEQGGNKESDRKQNIDLKQSQKPKGCHNKESDIRQRRQKTMKDYLSNLSPVCSAGSEWEERVEETQRRTLRQSDQSKEGGKDSAKRKLQFKETTKPFTRVLAESLETTPVPCPSPSLATWLEDLSLPRSAVAKLVEEEVELEDLLELVTREDLTRMGLKIGPQLRIWQKVQKYRTEGYHEF
jgi:hypothetical protein